MILSLTLLLATAAPALAGDVHIVDSSGAGDYPTIQQALNNAADEDLILVRPGSYPSFVVDDLDISIIADGGTVSTGTVRVRDLSAGKTLVIDGLNAVGASSTSPSASRGAWFINCSGSIRVQHSSLQAGDSNNTSGESGWAGAHVESCLDVSFTECTLKGSVDSGAYGDNTSTHFAGGDGLHIVQSLVSVFASEVIASDGHHSTLYDGGCGGDGAHLSSGSQLIAHSSDFRGGDGGGTSFDFGWGGDGGDGVRSIGASTAALIGCNLFAGQGAWGSGGCVWCGGGEDGSPSSGSSITSSPGDPRELCLLGQTGALREGASVTINLNGYLGSRATMLYSRGSDRRIFSTPERLFLLASPLIRLLPAPAPRPIPLDLPARNHLGTWSTSSLGVTFRAGSLMPGVEGERILTQALHRPTTGAWNLGAPTALFVVSSSL